MSHRRPEPNQTALENVLRNALRLAANSVDPAADGLDLIRAKISARRPGLLPGWWTAVPILLWPLLRRLEPVADWLRYALGVIMDRFRPEPARAGRFAWLGWLRPAAAMATGLFVVAAASLAIAALPAVIITANNSSTDHHTSGPGSGHPAPSSRSDTDSNLPSAPGSTAPGSATGSPSCPATSPPVIISASASPSGSPSPSPTTSPSPSWSPSPSPTGSPTGSGTPTPSDSASSSAPTNTPAAQASPAAQTAQAMQASPAAQTAQAAQTGLPLGSSASGGSSPASSVTSPTPPPNQQPLPWPCG